jgi:DNA-binding transcriptional regulator YiaG
MKLHHMTGIGLSNVYLLNGFHIDSDDGDEAISYENIAGLYFEIGRAISSKPYTMRPDEFRFVRKQLEMSQSEVATLFDKSDQAIAKWEKGLLPVPKAESSLLKIVWLSQNVKASEFKSTVLSLNASFKANDQPPIFAFSFSNGVWQFNTRAANTHKAKSSAKQTKHKTAYSQRQRLSGSSSFL